mgnify:FL=1
MDIPSYPTAQALVEAQAGRIFLHLEDKSFAEVGYLFGLDRYLKNENSMRSAITRAYNLVLDNPMKYDIAEDKAAFIHGLVAARGIAKKSPETLREEKEIEKLDISSLMLGARDLTAKLVRKKLEYLDRNPKALKEEKLKDLGWLAGVLFDKGQIIMGQATEHIAILSNVDAKMDPDEALAAILRMRDEIGKK